MMRLLGNILVVDPLPLLSYCPSTRVDLSVLSGRRTPIVNHIDSFEAFLSSHARSDRRGAEVGAQVEGD